MKLPPGSFLFPLPDDEQSSGLYNGKEEASSVDNDRERK
jgi:hypothetical protein